MNQPNQQINNTPFQQPNPVNSPKKIDGMLAAAVIINFIATFFTVYLRYHGETMRSDAVQCRNTDMCGLFLLLLIPLFLIAIALYGIDYKKHPKASIIGITILLLINPYTIDFIWDIFHLPTIGI